MRNTFPHQIRMGNVNMFPTLTLSHIHECVARIHTAATDFTRIHAFKKYIRCGIVMVTMHRAYCQTNSLHTAHTLNRTHINIFFSLSKQVIYHSSNHPPIEHKFACDAYLSIFVELLFCFLWYRSHDFHSHRLCYANCIDLQSNLMCLLLIRSFSHNKQLCAFVNGIGHIESARLFEKVAPRPLLHCWQVFKLDSIWNCAHFIGFFVSCLCHWHMSNTLSHVCKIDLSQISIAIAVNKLRSMFR